MAIAAIHRQPAHQPYGVAAWMASQSTVLRRNATPPEDYFAQEGQHVSLLTISHGIDDYALILKVFAANYPITG